MQLEATSAARVSRKGFLGDTYYMIEAIGHSSHYKKRRKSGVFFTEHFIAISSKLLRYPLMYVLRRTPDLIVLHDL